LGFRISVKVQGQVLGLGVQCLELGFTLQFTCKQEAANCLPALKHVTTSTSRVQPRAE